MLGLATLCALECYFPRISLFGPCADIIIIIIFFSLLSFRGRGSCGGPGVLGHGAVFL